MRSSDDGILIVDSRRPKVLESRRMIEMWKIPQNIVTHGDEEEKIHYVMAAIKNPKGFYDMIVRVHRHPEETVRGEFELKDGTVIDASSHPVLGKDGEQYGRIWKFRDITEMRRYWDMLETLSNTDGLTGLSNRRRFDELLEREWRSALRQGSYLSLILMDIDYFKEFNDRCGHMAGDDCLRRVAGVISSVVRRAGDLAARYGGEEFACILTDTDPDGAVAIANKIMKRIGRLAIQHPCSPGGGPPHNELWRGDTRTGEAAEVLGPGPPRRPAPLLRKGRRARSLKELAGENENQKSIAESAARCRVILQPARFLYSPAGLKAHLFLEISTFYILAHPLLKDD